MNRPSAHVIDASALLCLIVSEPGADRVEAVLTGAAMSAVNYAEVLSKLIDKGFDADDMVTDLQKIDVEIVPVTQALAEMAGRLRRGTRSAGLSLGDRCCLAMAKQLDVPAVTTDKAWKPLGEALGIRVALAR